MDDECIHGIPSYSCSPCKNGPETDMVIGPNLSRARCIEPRPRRDIPTAMQDLVARKTIRMLSGLDCTSCGEEIHPRFGCPCSRDREFRNHRDTVESWVMENVEDIADGHRFGLKIAASIQSSAISRAGRKAGRNALYQEGATLSQWDAKATRDDFHQEVRYFRPTVQEADPCPI